MKIKISDSIFWKQPGTFYDPVIDMDKPDSDRFLADERGNYRILAGASHRLRTPWYASPEQIKNIFITTTSDLYELGLYSVERVIQPQDR